MSDQITAGRMRHRVTLRRAIRERDRSGQPVPTGEYTTLSDRRPAEVVSISATEIVVGDQVRGVATHRVFTRWLPGITNEDQVVWQDRTLNVISARDPTGRRRLLILDCLEEV